LGNQNTNVLGPFGPPLKVAIKTEKYRARRVLVDASANHPSARIIYPRQQKIHKEKGVLLLN
jgi:hypothetical protein